MPYIVLTILRVGVRARGIYGIWPMVTQCIAQCNKGARATNVTMEAVVFPFPTEIPHENPCDYWDNFRHHLSCVYIPVI